MVLAIKLDDSYWLDHAYFPIRICSHIGFIGDRDSLLLIIKLLHLIEKSLGFTLRVLCGQDYRNFRQTSKENLNNSPRRRKSITKWCHKGSKLYLVQLQSEQGFSNVKIWLVLISFLFDW